MSGREEIHAATERIRTWIGSRRPEVALVLGSGLGSLTKALERPIRLPYAEIPGFPGSGVAGHAGELVAGRLAGREILCQSGRFHGYEGHHPAAIALPIRVFARLGVGVLVLTNAAGGIRRGLGPGTLMLINDHLNLTFGNALIGRVAAGEQRLPDMSAPYDGGLRGLAEVVAMDRGTTLEVGVYAGVMGPSYETPAEIQMLSRLGADAVGMSTVIEVIAARASGLRCLGISTITNRAAGLGSQGLSHQDVIRAAAAASEALGSLIGGVMERLSA